MYIYHLYSTETEKNEISYEYLTKDQVYGGRGSTDLSTVIENMSTETTVNFSGQKLIPLLVKLFISHLT